MNVSLEDYCSVRHLNLACAACPRLSILADGLHYRIYERGGVVNFGLNGFSQAVLRGGLGRNGSDAGDDSVRQETREIR